MVLGRYNQNPRTALANAITFDCFNLWEDVVGISFDDGAINQTLEQADAPVFCIPVDLKFYGVQAQYA